MPTRRTKTSDRTKANDRTQANNRPYSRSFSGAYKFNSLSIASDNSGLTDFNLNTFTVRAIVKINERQAGPSKLFGMNNNHYYFGFWSNDRILFLHRNATGGQKLVATPNFVLSDHYHVWREYTLRVNTIGSNLTVDMFIDGENVLNYTASDGFDSNFNQSAVVIGQSVVNTDISFVEFMDQAVTNEQIQELIKVKSCSEIGITPVDNWDFRDRSGTTLTGLNNDFTLTNNGDWNVSYPVARPIAT